MTAGVRAVDGDRAATPSWVADVSRAADVVESTGGPTDEAARAELVAAAARILAVLDPQPDQVDVERFAMMVGASVAAGVTATAAILQSRQYKDLVGPATCGALAMILGARVQPR